jgi:hypothetical protein
MHSLGSYLLNIVTSYTYRYSRIYRQRARRIYITIEEVAVKNGHGSWQSLLKLAGLNRCGKSCSSR